MHRSLWWRHGVPAAASVVLAVLVALLTGLVTGSGRSRASVIGLVVFALAWSGLEGLRAARSARRGRTKPAVEIRQQVGRASGDATVTAVRGRPPAGGLLAHQSAGEVTDQAKIIGVDQQGDS
jgi:hypothetical protein